MKGQLQEAEKKAPDERAYDSYDQIDDQTGSSSFYNLFGQKTGDKSYYQNPINGSIGIFILMFSSRYH